MKGKQLFLALGGVALLAVLITVGVYLLQPRVAEPQQDAVSAPPGVIASVNGEYISNESLDQEYEGLLRAYQQTYAENGSSLDDLLQGPSGAYNQLQIRFQALTRLVNRILTEQALVARDISVSAAEVESVLQEDFGKFITEIGITEEQLDQALADPQKQNITQDLLGIRENSVSELKARMRREIESTIRYRKLAEAVTGGNLDVESQKYQDQVNEWLMRERLAAAIEYFDPIINAYAKEAMIVSGSTLEDRRDLLAEAIAEYERVKMKELSKDPYLDYYLGRLYNLIVNWDLQLERDLVARAEETLAAQKEGEDLGKAIQYNRVKAAQALAAFQDQNEEQINYLLQADPGNPYYYLLLADFYYGNWEEYGISRAIRLLDTAIGLEPKYVDAYVLFGDVNMLREFYIQAIKDYKNALKFHSEVIADEDLSHLAERSKEPEKIERKLAEAYTSRSNQLDLMTSPPDNAAEERASSLAEAERILVDVQSRLGKDRIEELSLVAADLGDVEVLKGNYTAAQDQYLNSLELLVEKEVYIKLGKAYYLNQQLAEAEENYNTALELDPFLPKAHLGLAQVFRAEGDAEKASTEYELAFEYGANLTYLERRQIAVEALEVDPENVRMRMALATYYLDGHVYAAATREFETILASEPESVGARLGIGKVLLDKLQYAEAEERFREALGHTPTPLEEIELYELIVKSEKALAGPGKLVSDGGQEAMYRLAVLYLNNGQLSRSYDTLQELSGKYPGFRNEEIGQFRERLTRTVGDSLPGLPVADLGHEIITPSETHPVYNSAPPTSGWHYALPAHWGIHANTIEDEIQLRNLASGGVLIQYDPEIDQAMLERLLDLVKSMRRTQEYCQLILAPYESVESPIVLTAWNRLDRLEEFNRGRIISFVDAFIGRGPEAGEVGCSLSRD